MTVRKSIAWLAALSPILLGFGTHAAPVTWTFYETSALDCGVFRPPCPPTDFPLPLAALELADEISSGHSQYFSDPTGSFHINDGSAADPNSFRLTFPLTSGLIASPTFPADGQTMCCSRPTEVIDFNILWNAVAGALAAISIELNATEYNAKISMSGFDLATDGPSFGGCASITNPCKGPGFWQSNLAPLVQVSEPSVWWMLSLVGLGFGVLYSPRKPEKMIDVG